MIVLVTIVICLVPALLILYPFIKSVSSSYKPVDESSLFAELERRWESAIDGLRSAELELEIGNLEETDYKWLKATYTREAVLVLKAMDLAKHDEILLLESIFSDLQTEQFDHDRGTK